MTEAPAVTVTGLWKRFGRRDVFRGLDVAIAPGRVTAIVGPNAAGKTTLIKALLGLVRPDRHSGPIEVGGASVNGDPGYRERVGYMPQFAQFPAELSGREVLRFIQGLRNRSSDLDEELLLAFDLGAALDQPVRTLSGGTRQKLNAIVAFLFRPALVILDEPTVGLDPVAAGILKDKIRAAAGAGTTIILTSHILSEVEELARDLIFVVEGEVRFAGPLRELLVRTGEARLERAVARLLLEDRR
ncbi:MAG TPA: ABC transporter ATP-binding protein [Gemmatimonadales bacterium]|nr:ABC transporter ATP-binding protein [Gemmatimonadales bacterium]